MKRNENSKLYTTASNNRAEILLFIAARRGDLKDLQQTWEQAAGTMDVNCVVSNSCPLQVN